MLHIKSKMDITKISIPFYPRIRQKRHKRESRRDIGTFPWNRVHKTGGKRMAALNFLVAFTALVIAIMAYKKAGGSGDK
jgi:hypothetical protein